MKKEYDAIMIYDESSEALIYELRKLFRGCKYIVSFTFTTDNIVIIRTLRLEIIRIKMLPFGGFEIHSYKGYSRIMCLTLSGRMSSVEVSARFNHMIDMIIRNRNRKELENSNKGDKIMIRRYSPMTFDDMEIDDNSSTYSSNMIETSFPVIDTDMNCNWAASPSNAIKEKLNALFGRGIFNNPDVSSSALHIEKVIFNPKATIVFWSDHTKTIVKVGEDDKRDDEKGLAMAISKKFLGNKGNYYNEFRKWLK